MDRVRVQGIDDPVRLYELIGFAQESSAPLQEAPRDTWDGIVNLTEK